MLTEAVKFVRSTPEMLKRMYRYAHSHALSSFCNQA